MISPIADKPACTYLYILLSISICWHSSTLIYMQNLVTEVQNVALIL